MINKDLLKNEAAKIGVELDDTALDRFDVYAKLLVEKNRVMNLTGITEPDEIVIKHFIDSLELMRFAKLNSGARVADIGTGAGFPGVPLLIANNDIELTLVDSLKKRLDFLREVLSECELDAEIIHSRAEDAGQNAVLRETFDIVTARAVAPLNVLAEYCLPFVKVGGSFLALKGTSEDITQSEDALSVLGGSIENIYEYELPGGYKRIIVYVKKISQTPTQYPRKSKKIATKPL
ncbi:MAG: 16S rRNA (guanine(527)-N(7))-methyltransferase RsmG [Eubacterium sp.]|nr:16S rRNA (guanine(527)-N(7))-methyltransferase RsmG [Eubacterium sp.]